MLSRSEIILGLRIAGGASLVEGIASLILFESAGLNMLDVSAAILYIPLILGVAFILAAQRLNLLRKRAEIKS